MRRGACGVQGGKLEAKGEEKERRTGLVQALGCIPSLAGRASHTLCAWQRSSVQRLHQSRMSVLWVKISIPEDM